MLSSGRQFEAVEVGEGNSDILGLVGTVIQSQSRDKHGGRDEDETHLATRIGSPGIDETLMVSRSEHAHVVYRYPGLTSRHSRKHLRQILL